VHAEAGWPGKSIAIRTKNLLSNSVCKPPARLGQTFVDETLSGHFRIWFEGMAATLKSAFISPETGVPWRAASLLMLPPLAKLDAPRASLSVG
jgi:hypothetical protein